MTTFTRASHKFGGAAELGSCDKPGCSCALPSEPAFPGQNPRSAAGPPADHFPTLIDELLADQQTLTAVDRFSQLHQRHGAPAQERFYRDLIPLAKPRPGEQYAFRVDLDRCSGCKACVSACHSLNGLDEGETWRSVGLLVGGDASQQHVTSSCHHCLDPACLNGCPVLAYDKDPLTGIVRHLDDQCIGCSYCVMKCPYEAPKYSAQRGIVRKCDMCANRLAVDEAPACAQACPSEAIRIEIVEQDLARARLVSRSGGLDDVEAHDSFPPDSPDPRITLPTTRYLSLRPFVANTIAADHAALRLEPPHWPLVFMLLLTQAAAGMFLASFVARVCGLRVGWPPLNLEAIIFLTAGLAASVFHLGQPLKAWRSFLGWRKSWLSREIIALNLFAGLAVLSFARGASWLGTLAAVAGIIAVFASAMVYIDTARPFWAAQLVLKEFFGSTLVLGGMFAAMTFAWAGEREGATRVAALVALAVRACLFAFQRRARRAARENSRSPIHFNARVIRELLPWTARAQAALFISLAAWTLLALGKVPGLAPWWASLAALAALGFEIIGRFVFFSAGASKRMPGGVAA